MNLNLNQNNPLNLITFITCGITQIFFWRILLLKDSPNVRVIPFSVRCELKASLKWRAFKQYTASSLNITKLFNSLSVAQSAGNLISYFVNRIYVLHDNVKYQYSWNPFCFWQCVRENRAMTTPFLLYLYYPLVHVNLIIIYMNLQQCYIHPHRFFRCMTLYTHLRSLSHLSYPFSSLFSLFTQNILLHWFPFK